MYLLYSFGCQMSFAVELLKLLETTLAIVWVINRDINYRTWFIDRLNQLVQSKSHVYKGTQQSKVEVNLCSVYISTSKKWGLITCKQT